MAIGLRVCASRRLFHCVVGSIPPLSVSTITGSLAATYKEGVTGGSGDEFLCPVVPVFFVASSPGAAGGGVRAFVFDLFSFLGAGKGGGGGENEEANVSGTLGAAGIKRSGGAMAPPVDFGTMRRSRRLHICSLVGGARSMVTRPLKGVVGRG